MPETENPTTLVLVRKWHFLTSTTYQIAWLRPYKSRRTPRMLKVQQRVSHPTLCIRLDDLHRQPSHSVQGLRQPYRLRYPLLILTRTRSRRITVRRLRQHYPPPSLQLR